MNKNKRMLDFLINIEYYSYLQGKLRAEYQKEFGEMAKRAKEIMKEFLSEHNNKEFLEELDKVKVSVQPEIKVYGLYGETDYHD